MALTCPRCGTDVPNEAQYCPYCSLPKPKRGFAGAVQDKPEETTLAEHPKPPVAVAFRKANNESKKPAKRSTERPGKPPRKFRVSILSAAALVALFSVGIYIFVVPMVYSEQAEPKTVLSALDKLRRMPSNEPGLTLDARLLHEIETSRRVGNLAGYQGWTVRPIKGTKARVVLAFSYVEVGDVHQSAEWIADLTNNTFTPQTDLATWVSAR
jgi:hypothetical protein